MLALFNSLFVIPFTSLVVGGKKSEKGIHTTKENALNGKLLISRDFYELIG